MIRETDFANGDSHKPSSDRLVVQPFDFTEIGQPDPSMLASGEPSALDTRPDIGLPKTETESWCSTGFDSSFKSASASGADGKPESHTVVSRIFGNLTFDLSGQDGNEGTITLRANRYTGKFAYKDAHGHAVADAHQRYLSFGSHIEVEDTTGKPLAMVEERPLSSVVQPRTEYVIEDKDGNKIATATQAKSFPTDFTIVDRDGNLIATMHRPSLNLLRDHWDMTINTKGVVDDRVLMMLPAFKTASDIKTRNDTVLDDPMHDHGPYNPFSPYRP